MQAVGIKGRRIYPASNLDNIITGEESVKYTIHCVLTGKVLAKGIDYLPKARELYAKEEYPTIDHLIVVVERDGYNVAWITLDNSGRACMANEPLQKRLPEMCKVFKLVAEQYNNLHIVFSEAGRPNFYGDGKPDVKRDLKTWDEMAIFIEANIGMKYLGVYKNNPHEYAFGLAVYSNSLTVKDITVLEMREVGPGYNDGTSGVIIGDVLVVHYPIDFRGVGENNQGYIVTKNVIAAIEKYNCKLACGDMNTIQGNQAEATKLALEGTKYRLLMDETTFFAAYEDYFEDDPEKYIA